MTRERSFKGVQTDIRLLNDIFILSSFAPGLEYTQAQLAAFTGIGKRTVEYATKRLEAAGVISRTFGRGRRSYRYEICGVYRGRFGVLVFPHPCISNAIAINTGEGTECLLVEPNGVSVAKLMENLRLYG